MQVLNITVAIILSLGARMAREDTWNIILVQLFGTGTVRRSSGDKINLPKYNIALALTKIKHIWEQIVNHTLLFFAYLKKRCLYEIEADEELKYEENIWLFVPWMLHWDLFVLLILIALRTCFPGSSARSKRKQENCYRIIKELC